MKKRSAVVIVTGGRDFANARMVGRVLNVLKVTRIVEGGATGADTLAREWAEENDIRVDTIRADWSAHGRAAGLIRNVEMLKKYSKAIVVAFPGGRGTAHCVREAIARKHIVLKAR